MVGLLALLSFAAIQGRWSRLTRRIDIGLNMALSCLLLFLAVDGNIFQSSNVDKIARDVLALVAMIYIPCVGIMLFGEIGRPRPRCRREEGVVVNGSRIGRRSSLLT